MKPTIRTLIWLVLAITVAGQTTPVLDTSGEPLRRGTEYYIKPATTDDPGRFTLVARTPGPACPLYTGQESSSTATGLPVIFAPFTAGVDTVNPGRDVKISFSAATACNEGTAWRLQDQFIIATADDGDLERYYFKIGSGPVERSYVIEWCPDESCGLIGCSPPIRCQPVGSLVENGKRLLALDAPNSPIPIVFERA